MLEQGGALAAPAGRDNQQSRFRGAPMIGRVRHRRGWLLERCSGLSAD
jgi:hypothetical protein